MLPGEIRRTCQMRVSSSGVGVGLGTPNRGFFALVRQVERIRIYPCVDQSLAMRGTKPAKSNHILLSRLCSVTDRA